MFRLLSKLKIHNIVAPGTRIVAHYRPNMHSVQYRNFSSDRNAPLIRMQLEAVRNNTKAAYNEKDEVLEGKIERCTRKLGELNEEIEQEHQLWATKFPEAKRLRSPESYPIILAARVQQMSVDDRLSEHFICQYIIHND